MIEKESKDIENIRKRWDEKAERIKKEWDNSADTYEDWYKTFEGAVETYVGLELLKQYLPEDENAKILDAAGGTGRITLPLAKMGYSVTLCDISPRMLDVARQKMLKEGVLDQIKISECDVRNLPFPDESFDFVLCWDGIVEAANEFVRVTKRGGKISIFLVNKWAAAIDKFYKDPDSALNLIDSTPSYLGDDEGKHRAVSAEEARILFEAEGVRVMDIYAVCGWMDVLSIPEEVLESRNWDEKFFRQVTDILLRLSKESSVKGLSRHLVLYGERI